MDFLGPISSDFILHGFETFCRGVDITPNSGTFCGGVSDQFCLQPEGTQQLDIWKTTWLNNIHSPGTFCCGVIYNTPNIGIFCGEINFYCFGCLQFLSGFSDLHGTGTFCRGVTNTPTFRTFCGGVSEWAFQQSEQNHWYRDWGPPRFNQAHGPGTFCRGVNLITPNSLIFCGGITVFILWQATLQFSATTLSQNCQSIGDDICRRLLFQAWLEVFCNIEAFRCWTQGFHFSTTDPGETSALTEGTELATQSALHGFWLTFCRGVITPLFWLAFCGGAYLQYIFFGFTHWNRLTWSICIRPILLVPALIFSRFLLAGVRCVGFSNFAGDLTWPSLVCATTSLLLVSIARQLTGFLISLLPHSTGRKHSRRSDSATRTQTGGFLQCHRGGSPGPKSGGFWLKVGRLIWFGLLALGVYNLAKTRGEGCSRTMPVTETSPASPSIFFPVADVKLHGSRPEICCGKLTWLPDGPKVVKRSLKRAYLRAVRDGISWYRGRCFSAQDFQIPHALTAQWLEQQQKPLSLKQHRNQNLDKHLQSSRHLRIFQWNGSGLTTDKLDELKCWGFRQNLDVMVILETHWKYTNEWQDSHWMCVHSGDPESKGAGILVLISTKLAKMRDMLWTDPVPGRLVHIQIRFTERHVDLLACYQYTNSSEHRRSDHRSSWWHALDKHLGTLAKRNVLLLAGDFNCSLDACRNQIGTSLFRDSTGLRHGPRHPDMGQFHAVIRAHNLVALNTFNAKLGPTYRQGTSSSRIDFFLTRIPLADGRAKQVVHVQDAPFLPIEHQGHVPMICLLKSFWIPPQHDSTRSGLSSQQQHCIREAFFHNTPAWRDFMELSGTRLQAFLQQAQPSDSDLISNLHNLATSCLHSSFASAIMPRKQEPWHQNKSIILDKWRHRELCRQLVSVSLSHVVQAWFHMTRFQVLRRQHKRHAWIVRHQRFHMLLDEAQKAANCFDSHKLFQTINKFAPKQARRRVQIRNSRGGIASPVEEMAIMSSHVESVWKGPDQFHCASPLTTGMPFDEQAVLEALESIPATKAVARPFSPGLFWKAHAKLLAPHIFRFLSTWWHGSQSHVPDPWKDSWLMMIPKPGRAPTQPEALRPLALQEPIGKSLIGVLARLAQSESYDFFAPLPVWAYQKHRSTQHALYRVSLHCGLARELIRSQRPTVPNRQQRLPSFQVCGAIQLFLDLRRAFDTVSRTVLFARLEEVGISPRIAQLLASWHSSTRYHIHVHGTDQAIAVGSGVRQGCKAAPQLFNSYMAMLIHDLELLIDPAWLRANLDLYADDFRIGTLFYSEQELMLILTRFGIILDQLSLHGLHVNTSKSAILWTISGTSHRHVRHRLEHSTPQGPVMKIASADGSFFSIPVVQTTKYLGCMISYKHLESATLQHRLTLMKVAFSRLRKWLTAKQGMNQTTRLRLWTTCVLPVLTYGIFSVGIRACDLPKVQVTIFTMLRQILHNHSYRTRVSHASLLSHHSLLHPLELLWIAADTQYRSVTQSQRDLPAHDIAHTIDWSALQSVRDMIWTEFTKGISPAGATSISPEAEVCQPFFCDLCDFLCNDISSLRRHYTQAHQITRYRTYIPDPAQHMRQGMPICKHCQKDFVTWRSFMAHVQRGCQVLHPLTLTSSLPTGVLAPSVEMPEPGTDITAPAAVTLPAAALHHVHELEFGPRLLTLLRQKKWTEIHSDRAICQYLAFRCVLCGQFVGRAQALHLHMRTAHPLDHALIQTKAVQLTNILCDESPCEACGLAFVSSHVCNVWYQNAMLLTHTTLDHSLPALASSRLTCEICGICCKDAAALHLHLMDVHKLVSTSWHESRDSVAGQPACSHCNCLFETMEGLRSHINQGRCRAFDPNAPTETIPPDEAWYQALCKGQLKSMLGIPHNRVRLTLHCQCCTKTYARAADLSAHLLSAHSRLWAEAQPLVHQMLETFYKAKGCVCNPQCSQARLNHICLPYTQLAMQFFRLDDGLFQPNQITAVDLARFMPNCFPRVLRDRITQCLIQYDLTPLWKDRPVLEAMSHNCLLCGTICSTAELCLHMYEAHNCTSSTVQMYVHQLAMIMEPLFDTDHTCFACDQVFNHVNANPDAEQMLLRRDLVQSHLKAQCPVGLQLAAVLALAHHGGRLADGCGARRGLGTDHPGISEPGASAGSRPEARPESRRSQATQGQSGEGPQGPPAKRRRGRGASSTAVDGANGSQHGPRLADAEARRHFCALFQQSGANRKPEVAVGHGGDLASKCSEGPIVVNDDPAPPEAPADLDHRPHGPHPETPGCPGGLGAAQHGHSDVHHPPEQNLPVHGVECDNPLSPGLQSTSTERGEDASTLHGIAGHVQGCLNDSEIPCLTGETRESNLALAPAVVHAGRQTMVPDAIVESVQCVDTDGYELETTQQVPIAHGSSTGTSPGDEAGQRPTEGQGKGQESPEGQTSCPDTEDGVMLTRDQMRQILAAAVLSNPGNWCFANAAFCSLVWCMLSYHLFEVSMWGEQCNEIVRFVQHLASAPGDIRTASFFRDLLQCWGQSELNQSLGSISQQDAAEFVQLWLSKMQPSVFDMRWEKRVTVAEAVQIQDSSHAFSPLGFKFDDFLMQLSQCSLTTLGTTWHQVDGMRTCLLTAAPCVCIHLDRCVEGATCILKSTCFLETEEDVYLPVFLNGSTDFDHAAYTIIAMMCHLGDDRAGHYRTALRVSPVVLNRTQPVSWLLLDDWRAPEALWSLPDWFARNVTVIWLVRSDAVHLHTHTMKPPASLDNLWRLLELPETPAAERPTETEAPEKTAAI